MRKISAMYEYSGGTDYRHTCYECPNCIRVQCGKRAVHKCISYGNTASPATDWNAAHIACRAFGKKPPKGAVFFWDRREQASDQIEGQMSLSEFIPM